MDHPPRIADILKRASVHFRITLIDNKTQEKAGFAWLMVGETFTNEIGWEIKGKERRSNHGIKDVETAMQKIAKELVKTKCSFSGKFIIDTYGKPKGLTKTKAEKLIQETWERISKEQEGK